MISASGNPKAISCATFREFLVPVKQKIVVDAIIIPHVEKYLPVHRFSGNGLPDESLPHSRFTRS